MHAAIDQYVSLENKKILNIGCGSGHLELALDSKARNCEFHGIDINPVRIEEASSSTKNIKNSQNTFNFEVKDLCEDYQYKNKLSNNHYNIIFSRFVLSHLPDAVTKLSNILNCLKKGGIIVLEEFATTFDHYMCNTNNHGYQIFVEAIKEQLRIQNCDHNIAFKLLDYLQENNFEIITTFLEQPILRTKRQKSIIRLGAQEAELTLLNKMSKNNFDNMIKNLEEFEEDNLSYGLYTRSLGIIAKKL